jgi:hypothetical protein
MFVQVNEAARVTVLNRIHAVALGKVRHFSLSRGKNCPIKNKEWRDLYARTAAKV